MKFIQSKIGTGGICIKCDENTNITLFFFMEEPGAEIAYNAFKNGLARQGNVSLFDADTGLYLVGTMDQLGEGRGY